MEEAIRTYLSEGFRRINFPKDVFRASDIAVYRRVVVDVLEEFKSQGVRPSVRCLIWDEIGRRMQTFGFSPELSVPKDWRPGAC